MRIAVGEKHIARATRSAAGKETRGRAAPCLAVLAWTGKPSKDGLRLAAQIRLYPKL